MGAKSRTKGASYEREVANKMKAIWPDARRGGHDQAGPMGRPDVDGTPYWIEAKRYARVLRSTILAAHAQADAAANRASDDRPTLVVTRSDREQSQAHFRVAKVRPDTGNPISVIVSMPLSEWLAACEAKQ